MGVKSTGFRGVRKYNGVRELNLKRSELLRSNVELGTEGFGGVRE